MISAPRRRGVETVESSGGGVEQADEVSEETGTVYDIERGPVSPDSSSVESITDERSADPLTDERSNIERA
jgi:hypothetical protein